MYKLCKTEQSVKRQREIENCLLGVMRTKSFEDITITELCEKMKMPRKAFYRYFESKDDALAALIDHSMSEYSGFTVDRSGESNRSLTSELEEYFIFWYHKRDLLDVLDKSGLIGILIERTVNYPVGDRILIERFLPDDDVNVRERVFKFAFSGLVYTMICWYRDGFKVSTRDMAVTACRMLKEPLFPELEKLGINS
ncbi:MAG: TetR/AcrR family transcriptional regulator [Clostridia bacterium]|nr:TetR/AcrR family transcriptional regulator [Clostridia bacterium]